MWRDYKDALCCYVAWYSWLVLIGFFPNWNKSWKVSSRYFNIDHLICVWFLHRIDVNPIADIHFIRIHLEPLRPRQDTCIITTAPFNSADFLNDEAVLFNNEPLDEEENKFIVDDSIKKPAVVQAAEPLLLIDLIDLKEGNYQLSQICDQSRLEILFRSGLFSSSGRP